MKTRITAILAGVATLHLLLISVITVSGGCKSPEALKPRRYASSAKDFMPSQQPAATTQPEAAAAAAPETPVLGDPALPEEPVKAEAATPAETAAPAVKTPAAGVTVEEKLLTYKVESGDSLWTVARKFGVGTGELAAQNKLGPKPVLRIGQTLVIPPGGVENYKASASAKKSSTAKKATAGIAAPSTKAPSTAAASSANGTKYTVASGDSLWKIAAKHKVKSSAIAEANHITTSTQLKVGQVLIIPGKKATAAPEATSATKSSKKETATPVKATEKDLSAEETKALESLKTEDTKAEDLLKDIPTTETPKAATPVEKVTTTVTETPTSSGDIVEVTEDIMIEDFAKKHKVSVDNLKKANPGISEGKLTSGMIVTMP